MAIPKSANSDFMKRARARFKQGDEATTEQRTREREDIAFYNGKQWPDDIVTSRQGQASANGLPPVPARPTLTINKVREPVRQTMNQERASEFNVSLVPADDFGDLGEMPNHDEVTTREGLIRRIQRQSKAQDARSWAFARAAQSGQGYYRINTDYLPGKTWDQDICIERIYDQSGVVLDPSHTQPDGSDAEWGFIGYDFTADRYKATYGTLPGGGKNHVAEASDSDAEWRALGNVAPKWFGLEEYDDAEGKKGTRRSVRVTIYFYKEHTQSEVALLQDGTVVPMKDLPEGVEPMETRTVIESVVKMATIDGVQVLEETEWHGKTIPIIKVLGEELQPLDGERRAEGMVRNARDSQQGFNMMVSKWVETVGLTPLPALSVDPEAIKGYESWYAVSNTRALPYLPSRTYDEQYHELRAPSRPPVEPNMLPMAQSIAMFDDLIKSTTAVPDPTLGNVDPTLKSGKAIREVVQNAQQSTSNFLDNLARSMRYEGEIINDLLYPIYGTRPGRLVRLITGEGDAKALRIEAGDQQDAQPPQTSPMSQARAGAASRAKLTKDAHFNVIVKVSKNSDSRRDQFVRMFSDIIGADPQQMMVAGDLFYQSMDIPYSQQLAKRQKLILLPAIQKMLADEDSGQDQQAKIAMLEGKVQQQDEMLKMADGAVNELMKKAEGKELDAQTKLQIVEQQNHRDLLIEQARIDADLEKARMANATTMYVAELEAKQAGILQAQEAEHEAIGLQQEQSHEAEQKALDRDNMERQSEQQQMHEASMAERAAQVTDSDAG